MIQCNVLQCNILTSVISEHYNIVVAMFIWSNILCDCGCDWSVYIGYKHWHRSPLPLYLYCCYVKMSIKSLKIVALVIYIYIYAMECISMSSFLFNFWSCLSEDDESNSRYKRHASYMQTDNNTSTRSNKCTSGHVIHWKIIHNLRCWKQ